VGPFRQRVLIVDDEPDIRELLEITLGRMGLDTDTAEDLAQARARLAANKPQLCLADMRLPDGSGISLVEHIQQEYPSLPVAIITAHGSVEAAITALKAGAFDFISKPIELERLRALVTSALRLDVNVPDPSSQGGLTGHAPCMEALRLRIAKVARSQAPVHISGESGAGKELVARQIHTLGPRAQGPFIAVNCGAIPRELMESEFFGHRRGSFTGAVQDKRGLFQEASGGTLFLDEVGDLPLSMQVKLLRAIQEKAVRPIGGTREEATDVRILSATHTDLRMAVERGDFRSDLYYRINVIDLRVPALRERTEDIPLLAARILARLSEDSGVSPPIALDDDALRLLCRHNFPGNVRELENLLERAVTLAEGDTISTGDLQLETVDEAGDATQVAPAPLTEGPHPAFGNLEAYLDGIERTALEAALAVTDGNKTAAADLLGVSFRSLRYRLQKLGMD